MLTSIRNFLAVAALLFVAMPASAIPTTYGFQIGSGSNIVIQAHQAIGNQLVFNETLTLSTDSFVTWDSAGIPDAGFGGTLEDFLLRVDPGQGPFSTVIPYGPFDSITVETGSIAPAAVGYTTLFTFPLGGGHQFQAGPIEVNASYSATGPGGATTGGPVPAPITGVNNLAGTINFPGPGEINIVLDGIAMGTVDGTPFGQAGNDLTLTATINFFGNSEVTPTPEPSTGLMVIFGLVAVAAQRRLKKA